MKGTATLLLNETYNERKKIILSSIVVCRGLIKAIEYSIANNPTDLAYEVLKQEKQYINNSLAEITELERWRLKEGLDKDEAFQPKKKD